MGYVLDTFGLRCSTPVIFRRIPSSASLLLSSERRFPTDGEKGFSEVRGNVTHLISSALYTTLPYLQLFAL